MKSYIKIILAFMGAEIVHLTGGLDTIFRALILLMIIDYITGIIKAIKEKNLNSEKGYFGILKKILMLLIVIVAQQIDLIFKEQNIELFVRDAVVVFYVMNEIISIIENAGQFVPVPEKIKDVLSQLKNKSTTKSQFMR